MARLMGFPSYAEYQLDSFSLAARPAAVHAFLERLAAAVAPKAAAEVAELAQLKRRLAGGGPLQPWDRQYLVAAAEAGGPGGGGGSGSSGRGLAAHAAQASFPLEAVVEGLSELLRRSMGVSLQEHPLGRGEWEGTLAGCCRLQTAGRARPTRPQVMLIAVATIPTHVLSACHTLPMPARRRGLGQRRAKNGGRA